MDDKELDISKHDQPIKCSGNLLAQLPQDENFNYGDRQKSYLEVKSLGTLKEDGRDQKVAHVSIDTRSDQPYFIYEKGIVHDRDDIVKNNAMELLKLQKTSLNLRARKGDHSLSVNETVACNAMLWPTDSELASSATQNICSEGNDEAIVDQEMNQMTAELDIPNFAEKAEAFPHMSGIMNTATLVNQVEKVSHKSHDDSTVEKEMEQFIMETPANSALISTTVDNVHKQVHITHVSTSGENNGVLSNVNKFKDNRQKGKGKAMKKRLVSDLIGDTPFELCRFNEVNWNHTVKHKTRKAKFGIQRRKMIGKWRVSKAAAYNLRKFKGKIKYGSKDFEKRHLPSMDIKRKRRQPGVSYQSSALAKPVKETRRPVKRRFVSKTSEGPHNEVLSSQASRKEMPTEDHISHAPQTQTKTHSDQDDDLLIDLASFMAQNQFERNATLPSSTSLQEKGCAREFVMEKKILEAEDLNHVVIRKSERLSDAIPLHPTGSSKQHLPKEQDGSRCISTNTSEDGWAHLLVEDGRQQINQMKKSLSLETLGISGQSKEAGLISKIQDVNVSGSIYPCKISETVERNLDKHGDACSLSHIHNLANTAVMKRQNDKTLRTFQRRRPALQKSIKQLHELVKSSCNQVSLIDTTNAALNAALLNGKPSMPVFASTAIQHCDNALGGSLSSNSCQIAVSAPAQMVATTCFASTQISARTGFVSQTLNQPDLSPTSQIRHPNSQVLIGFASSDGKVHHLNQPGGCSKAERTDITPLAECDQELGALQPIVRERDFSGNHMVRSESRDGIVESSRGHVQEAKDWVTQKQDACLEQLPSASTLPVSCSFAPQLSASMKDLPVKNFPMERRSQHLLNSHESPPLLASVPRYFTLSAPPSLGANPMAGYSMCKDYSESLRSSYILSFAQGNKLDTETALSQESFAQGKFDLQAYIQERIEVHHPSKAAEARAHKRSAAVDAEKGTQKRLKPSSNLCDKSKPDERLLEQVLTQENEKTQVANSRDSKVCTLNRNPAEVTELENGLPIKRKVGTCEKVVKLPMDADVQNHKTKKSVEAKAESQNTQPVILPLFQIHTPGKNIDFISKRTLKSDKLKATDELKNNLPTNIPVVNQQKYLKKTGKEVTEGRKKLEAPSSFIQHFFDLHAIENYIIHGKFYVTPSSQALPPKGVELVKLDAGCNHVLKPIAQNTQQCLPIHSLVDQCGKFVNTLEKPPNAGHPTEKSVYGARTGPSTIAIPESVGGIGSPTARCPDIKPDNVEGCNRDLS